MLFYWVIMLDKRLLSYIKQGLYIKFYKSREWLAKRADIFKRDNYECQHCKREGKFSPADCVHHIKHLREFPMLALTDSNLVALCNPCHNKEHPEKLARWEPKPGFINPERWE